MTETEDVPGDFDFKKTGYLKKTAVDWHSAGAGFARIWVTPSTLLAYFWPG